MSLAHMRSYEARIRRAWGAAALSQCSENARVRAYTRTHSAGQTGCMCGAASSCAAEIALSLAGVPAVALALALALDVALAAAPAFTRIAPPCRSVSVGLKRANAPS